jgi:hypothetical protein
VKVSTMKVADAVRIAVGIAPERAETHYYLGDAIGYLASDNPEAMRELAWAAELTTDPEFLSTILSRQANCLRRRATPLLRYRTRRPGLCAQGRMQMQAHPPALKPHHRPHG